MGKCATGRLKYLDGAEIFYVQKYFWGKSQSQSAKSEVKYLKLAFKETGVQNSLRCLGADIFDILCLEKTREYDKTRKLQHFSQMRQSVRKLQFLAQL